MSPSDYRYPPAASALEQMPQLAQRICALWGQPAFEPFIKGMIMDSRDGRRQGLPWDVALELLFLEELSVARRALAAANTTGAPFDQVYQQYLAQARATPESRDPWADPGNKDTRRSSRDRGREPVAGNTSRKRSWWRRLFG